MPSIPSKDAGLVLEYTSKLSAYHMRTNLFKKVLATVLATAVMWTSVAPSTVEAAKKDTKKPTVQVQVVRKTTGNLVKNSRNAGTFKKGFHTLKKNSYYSCKDLQIKISDTSGIKSIKLEGTVRDLYLLDWDLQQCLTRKVSKKIKVGKSSKKVTFKLSENINKITNGKNARKYDQYMTDGSYKLTVVDKAGNKQVIKFTVDTQKPVRKPNISVPSKYLKKISKVITITPSDPNYSYQKTYLFDALSGLDWVKINGTKINANDISTLTTVSSNTVTTKVEICDKAGNTNSFIVYAHLSYSK